MKKCEYCGRDNANQALHCKECGTEFIRPPEVNDRAAINEPQGPPRPLGEILLEQWQRRQQRFGRKLVLRWLIFVALPFLGAGAAVYFSHGDISFGFGLILFFLPLPISIRYVGYGVRLARMSRHLVGAQTTASLGNHVLLLRPFVADSISADRNTFLEVVRSLIGWTWQAPAMNLQRLISREVGSRIGPMVAIANPSDPLPATDGSQTIIVGDTEWQQAVADLAQSARCVILELGATRGFCWELRHVRQNVELRKVFCVVDLEGWLEKHWPDLCRNFQETGFILPSMYPGDGTVIRFEPDGRGVVAVRHAQDAAGIVSAVESCLCSRHGQLAGVEVPSASVSCEMLESPLAFPVPSTSVPEPTMPVGPGDTLTEMRQWRRRLLRGVFSGGVAGCLLICLSLLGLAAGLGLTIWAIITADVQVSHAGRGLGLIVSLPSIGLAMAVFYTFCPHFYRLHRALQRRHSQPPTPDRPEPGTKPGTGHSAP